MKLILKIIFYLLKNSNNKNKLQKLNGYDIVKDFLEENLTRFAGFKIVLDLWEKLKEKYKGD